MEILSASPILLKSKDSIIECSMKCFSEWKLAFGFENIKIIKFTIIRSFFPLREHVWDELICTGFWAFFDSKFFHEERHYSDSSRLTFIPCWSDQPILPKAHIFQLCKGRLYKNYLVRAEDHLRIKNSSYFHHDTERLWTKCLRSSPGDQRDRKRLTKTGENCIQVLLAFQEERY